jgi:hypothetical protein
LSKSLLAKSRRVLLTNFADPAGPSSSPAKDDDDITVNSANVPGDQIGSSGDSITAPRKDSANAAQRPENTNVIWQSEMERGYDNLLDSIYPHISDLPGTNNLRR